MKKLIKIMCIGLAAVVGLTTTADAQDYKALRKNTWSVYAQGGASWATGVGFENIDPSVGTSTAVEMGAGVNYNIRPWVRLGLNYEFSKFKREQRFGELVPMGTILDMSGSSMSELREQNGGVAYANLWTTYHNLDLTAEFNIMEIWKNRKCVKFNLYAGTGVGVMFAKGNGYSIAMGYEEWTDPANYQGGLQVADDWTSVSWIRANNNRHNFKSIYIPAILSAEYDVTPQLTLGVKGTYKAVLSPDAFAPDGLVAAALVVRYNFGTAKAGFKTYKKKYECTLGKYKDVRAKYEDEMAARRAEKEEYWRSLDALNNENAALKGQLDDCLSKLNTKFVVSFDQGVSKVTQFNKARLADLAEQLKSDPTTTISLVGEASVEGGPRDNQRLSERRLANVLSVLKANGISGDRIKFTDAIGSTSNIADASARRVLITINR